MREMVEFIGEEKLASKDEPIVFENKTDSSFDVGMGVVFHESGIYEVSILGNRTTVSKVTERTGKWIPTQNPQWKAYYHDKCSVCGWWNTKNAVCRDSKKKAHSLNYCPSCGARMKKGDTE